MMHCQIHQQSSGSPLLNGQSVRCSSVKKKFSHRYICGFVFALNCKNCILERLAVYSVPMSLKASSIIADRLIEKSVGTSTHPCLTPFVIAHVSEISPPFLPFTIIPVYRLSIMVVNFSWHPYFLSSFTQSSPPSGVECLRKVNKDNIALFLELS